MSIDNLMTKAENKFILTKAAAGRAGQILAGSLPYVNDFDPTNPIITALKELARDKIKIKVLKGVALEKAQEQEKADQHRIEEQSLTRSTSVLDTLAKGTKRALKKEKE
ncbi:MAG: DNA-directed RNA polymerase subunit omega [Candidatus Margulisiibacteriota bacterium]